MDQVYHSIPVTCQLIVRLLDLTPGDEGTPIRVSLKGASLEDASVRYEALSYTWGSPLNPATIICNGNEMKVTQNLYSALRRLRERNNGKVRTFWIDAVCINQNDLDERAAQVSIMLQIYKKAWRLTIDLGETFENQEELFNLLFAIDKFNNEHKDDRNVYTGEDLVSMGLPPANSAAWASWQQLLSRPYFMRVWVIQEFAAGQDALCLLGNTYFPWWNLFELVTGMDIHGIGEEHRTMPASLELARSAMHGKNALRGLHKRRLDFQNGQAQELLDLLYSARFAQATDARDMIYGVLGLATDVDLSHPNFKISYQEEISQLYLRISKALVQTSTTQIPVLLYEAGYALRQRRVDLPSWSPDWSVPRAGSPLGGLKLYNAATAEAAQGHVDSQSDTLHVKGFFVDSVVHLISEYRPELSEGNKSSVDFGIASFLWLNEAYQLVLAHHPSQTYPHTGEETKTALWRTLIADKTHQDERVPTSYGEEYESILTVQKFLVAAFENAIVSATGERSLRIEDDTGEFEQARTSCHLFRLALQNSMYTKRFAITKDGRFAMVPGGTSVGDSICVIAGAAVPFVASPTEDECTWVVVGESYVHGIMDGEILKQHDTSQWQTLKFV